MVPRRSATATDRWGGRRLAGLAWQRRQPNAVRPAGRGSRRGGLLPGCRRPGAARRALARRSAEGRGGTVSGTARQRLRDGQATDVILCDGVADAAVFRAVTVSDLRGRIAHPFRPRRGRGAQSLRPRPPGRRRRSTATGTPRRLSPSTSEWFILWSDPPHEFAAPSPARLDGRWDRVPRRRASPPAIRPSRVRPVHWPRSGLKPGPMRPPPAIDRFVGTAGAHHSAGDPTHMADVWISNQSDGRLVVRVSV